MSQILIQSVSSGVAAGVVSVVATHAVIKFGGAVAAVLTGSPHIIAILAFALAMSNNENDNDLRETLWAVAVGELFCTIIWLTWRYLPSTMWLRQIKSSNKQLAIIVSATLLAWLSLGVAFLFLQPVLHDAGISMRYVGIFCWAMHFCIAMYVTVVAPIPMPRGSHRVTYLGYAFRAIVPGGAIGVAVYLSDLNRVLGALASTAPIISTCLCASLFKTQPRAVVSGLASSSVPSILAYSAYGGIFSELLPVFKQSMNLLPSVVVTTIVCFAISILGISIPILLLLNYQSKRMSITISDGGKMQAGPIIDNAQTSDAATEQAVLEDSIYMPPQRVNARSPYQRRLSSVSYLPEPSASTLDLLQLENIELSTVNQNEGESHTHHQAASADDEEMVGVLTPQKLTRQQSKPLLDTVLIATYADAKEQPVLTEGSLS